MRSIIEFLIPGFARPILTLNPVHPILLYCQGGKSTGINPDRPDRRRYVAQTEMHKGGNVHRPILYEDEAIRIYKDLQAGDEIVIESVDDPHANFRLVSRTGELVVKSLATFIPWMVGGIPAFRIRRS